ncbi:hypothetical protein ZWY2020_002328 [Hordeum vulgare]|nr:hypothetical protein ZWY2020_002328 [Hordeum vulgare]
MSVLALRGADGCERRNWRASADPAVRKSRALASGQRQRSVRRDLKPPAAGLPQVPRENELQPGLMD